MNKYNNSNNYSGNNSNNNTGGSGNIDCVEIKQIIDYFVAVNGTDEPCHIENITGLAVYNILNTQYKHDFLQLVALYNHHYFKKYYFQLIRLANSVRLAILNTVI